MVRAPGLHLVELLLRRAAGAAPVAAAAAAGLEIRRIVVRIRERVSLSSPEAPHMKLLRDIPADGAGVGAHRREFQTCAGEDARVGVVLRAVPSCSEASSTWNEYASFMMNLPAP